MQARPMSSRGVCLSVCVSVTFVHCVKMNKRIFKIFSSLGSQAILVFPYQTAWQYSDGDPPNGGIKYRWGRQKLRFWAYIRLHCLLLMLQQARCCQHGRWWTTATVLQVNCDTSLVVSVGVDYGRRRWNVYDKKPQRYAKDKRIAHLTAHSDKPVACLTNNKRLYSTFCTVEANYWQTQSIVQPLCDSRATCWYREHCGIRSVVCSVLTHCKTAQTYRWLASVHSFVNTHLNGLS